MLWKLLSYTIQIIETVTFLRYFFCQNLLVLFLQIFGILLLILTKLRKLCWYAQYCCHIIARRCHVMFGGWRGWCLTLNYNAKRCWYARRRNAEDYSSIYFLVGSLFNYSKSPSFFAFRWTSFIPWITLIHESSEENQVPLPWSNDRNIFRSSMLKSCIDTWWPLYKCEPTWRKTRTLYVSSTACGWMVWSISLRVTYFLLIRFEVRFDQKICFSNAKQKFYC